MALSDVFERLGRAVFESPFGANQLAKDAPEFAEIRLDVLELVKAKSHRIAGKNVFAHDLIRIELLGIPEEQQDVFQSEFVVHSFTEELKTALHRSSCRFPDDLAIEFRTTSRLPEKDERWFSIETSMRQQAQSAPSARSVAMLTVLKGTANQPELKLEKARTNIGRTAEVSRATGPSRRNDLIFLGSDEADKTVSREHAHILRSSTGEYRLLNDRTYKGDANCGLWIVRDGLSFPVHRGHRGTLLQAGDEIYVGSAVLRFSPAGP